MSKDLKEERKQATQIPLGEGICKGPEVGSCLLRSVNNKEFSVAEEKEVGGIDDYPK